MHQVPKLSQLFILVILLQACRADAEPAKLASGTDPKPEKILSGGYPGTEDLQKLKDKGVTTIVALLDERLDAEDKLLKQEEQRARAMGFTFINRPIASELSRNTTKEYRKRVQAAAETIASQQGTVYFHCYHGIHRAGSVAEYLRSEGYIVEDFVVQARRDEAATIDKAQTAYEAGEHKRAIKLLGSLPHLDHRAQALLGWAYYRSGDYKRAEKNFKDIIDRVPEANEAHTGLGYCALRKNKLDLAEREFKLVLASEPRDKDAHLGVGLVRMRQKRYERAENHFEEVLKDDPNNEEAAALLQQVRAKLN